MMCEAITAMSRALDLWPASVMPVDVLERVFFRPQACAWRFIISTKSSTVPATASASATEASLPDLHDHPVSSSSTVGRIVVSMNISEGSPLRSFQARALTARVCSSVSFLSRSAPKTM